MKQIEMLDEVHTKANKEARGIVKHALAYKSSYWKDKIIKDRSGNVRVIKEQAIKTNHLITGRNNSGGTFLTGLIPRIKKYCKKRNIKVEFKLNRENIKSDRGSQLEGITFRKDQKQAIRKAKVKRRGIIVAPTGSGKTIVALGIISMFHKRKSIFVMHTTDLWNQTKSEAHKYQLDLPPIFYPSGSEQISKDLIDIRNNYSDALLICLIQSLAKVDPSLYIDLFDLTLIDEAHHVVSTDSQYGKFMSMNLSPRRYGFTATIPTNSKQLLINEGLIGPVVAKLTTKEGIQKGIIAKPKVKVINVPYNIEVNQRCKRYSDFYDHGIINNKARNNEIRKITEKAYKKKQPILIIIEKLDHGRAIQNLIQRRSGINIPFIHGSSPTEVRNQFKQQLLNEDINGIIASRIWMEGINIPNLRIIVYAAGMKEKKKTLQAMGRGLRTTDKKKKILLIDFLDPYKYLAEHSILRLQTYNQERQECLYRMGEYPMPIL